jgi:hypothetical protein
MHSYISSIKKGQQERAKKYYDLRNGASPPFEEGKCLFLKYTPHATEEVPSKIMPKCTGPWRILQIHDTSASVRHISTNKPKTVPLRRCIPATSDIQDPTPPKERPAVHLVGEYVIVRAHNPRPKERPWNLAQITLIPDDNDTAEVHWLNCHGKNITSSIYMLAWTNGEQEKLTMLPKPNWERCHFTVKTKRFVGDSFTMSVKNKGLTLPKEVIARITAAFLHA